MSLGRDNLEFQNLIRGEGTEEGIDSMLTVVMHNTPHPAASDSIYAI
ncbi:hypothetical protein [Paenibacillus sp. NPDC055715]